MITFPHLGVTAVPDVGHLGNARFAWKGRYGTVAAFLPCSYML